MADNLNLPTIEFVIPNNANDKFISYIQHMNYWVGCNFTVSNNKFRGTAWITKEDLFPLHFDKLVKNTDSKFDKVRELFNQETLTLNVIISNTSINSNNVLILKSLKDYLEVANITHSDLTIVLNDLIRWFSDLYLSCNECKIEEDGSYYIFNEEQKLKVVFNIKQYKEHIQLLRDFYSSYRKTD
jgi:hypothetical protein